MTSCHEGWRTALLQSRLALQRRALGRRPPTQGMREAAKRLNAELTARLGEFQSLQEKELAELNRQARTLELPHIIVPPAREPP